MKRLARARSGWRMLLFFIFVSFTLATLMAIGGSPRAKEQPDFRMIFSAEGISWIEAIDARTLMTPVFDEILADRPETYSLTIVNTTSELIDRLKGGTFNTVIASQLEYVKISQQQKLIPLATDFRSGKATFKLLLMVRQDAKIKDLGALKNRRLSLDKLDPIKNAYLHVLLTRRKLKDPGSFFSAIKVTRKEKSAVLDLFLGETDACLVKDVTFSAMAALNPQLKKTLTAINASEEFVNGLLFVAPGTPRRLQEILKEAALHVHERTTGKQALSIFRITKMVPTQEKDYDSVRRLYTEYQKVLQVPQ